MKTSFGFASSLNRDLSTTNILLEIFFLLVNSLIISTGRNPFYLRPGQRIKFKGLLPPTRQCIDVNREGILKCSVSFEMYDYREFPYYESRCLPSCDDSYYFNRGIMFRSLSGRGIKRIDPDARFCLNCVEELDLSGNYLELKFRDNFQNLSKLRRLKLSNNGIKSLTRSAFRNLVWLEKLFLDSNRIQSIQEGSFNDLKQLQVLNLEGNQLDSLNYQILSPLTNLKDMNLKNNKLRSLSDTFKKNHTLEVLDLSQNSDLTLESDTFEGLKSLKELSINDCKITSFPINLFQSTRGLKELHIDNNRLGEISFETFSNLKSLSRFYAVSNNISVLKDKPFKYHRNLTVIDLTRNSLVYINESDLEGLSSLKVLRLPFNSIEYVSQTIFKDMPLLETLDLKHNKIKTSFSFENNTKLKIIDISYNQLSDFIFTGLENLSLLKEFRVTNNAIKNLSIPMLIPPNSPSIIPKLYLERNKIKRIMFMTTIKPLNSSLWNFTVYLQGNPLVCDCHMYDLYRYLIDNTLSPVKFESSIICPPENRDIKGMNKDYFKCNIKESCPYDCECFYRASDKARIVKCANRNYTNLPLEIPPDIHILDIEHNSLTSLANLKEPCWENLTKLYSEGNEITFEEFSMPRNLKFLGLKGNKIEALPEVIRKHAETFKDFKMTLSNNLWRCDCWVLHLKIFLSKHENQVKDKDSIFCTFANDTVSFFNLISITDSDICPDIHLYALVIAFMLLILCVYILRRRYKLRISEIWNTECPPHIWNLCCVRMRRRDKSKLFDCFLSYCLEDKSVAMAIVREMNKKAPRYVFCTHERNWTVDCHVTNSISFSIQSSRSTLVVLSEAFAKSEWFHMEFRRAFEQLQKDKTFKLILVIVGEIPDKSELHANVQFFLYSGMYLKFGEKWFWHKLREAFRSLDTFVKLNIPEDDESP